MPNAAAGMMLSGALISLGLRDSEDPRMYDIAMAHAGMACIVVVYETARSRASIEQSTAPIEQSIECPDQTLDRTFVSNNRSSVRSIVRSNAGSNIPLNTQSNAA